MGFYVLAQCVSSAVTLGSVSLSWPRTISPGEQLIYVLWDVDTDTDTGEGIGAGEEEVGWDCPAISGAHDGLEDLEVGRSGGCLTGTGEVDTAVDSLVEFGGKIRGGGSVFFSLVSIYCVVWKRKKGGKGKRRRTDKRVRSLPTFETSILVEIRIYSIPQQTFQMLSFLFFCFSPVFVFSQGFSFAVNSCGDPPVFWALWPARWVLDAPRD